MMPVTRYLSLALKRNLLSLQSIEKQRGAVLLMLFLLAASSSARSDFFPQCDVKQQAVEASLQRIENEWPMRGSGDAVSQYIQKLGAQLAHFSVYGRNISWRFSVVRNLAPNAFSIGGGYVFITDGAVNFVQNESELAAILAHELGHERAGHFCGVSDLNNSGGLFDIFSAPKIKERQVGVGSMMLSIDPVKEQQADKFALSILKAGGYDPHAMLEVARRLSKGNAVHPMDSQRLQSLESLLAKIPPTQAQDSEDFRTIKRTLADERAAW
jgi:predicted Zn-dependent protease